MPETAAPNADVVVDLISSYVGSRKPGEWLGFMPLQTMHGLSVCAPHETAVREDCGGAARAGNVIMVLIVRRRGATLPSHSKPVAVYTSHS